MSQEWYLIKSPHGQISGYETDALNDFGQDGFDEVLASGIAVDVELCNYDLSDCKSIRAVVLHRTQDTKLKTFSRMLLVPIGTCKSGMYIKYKERFWLITGIVDDNAVFEKAIMQICNHKLTWVNASGKIIQRWANITSASQYNNGETGTENYSVRTDQLMILTPDDDECLLLEHGKRFVIDRRCEIYERSFAKTVKKDISKPLNVYRLTRSDSILFDYQDSGYHQFMVYQDEQREQDGYYVIDGKGYWLCDIVKSEKQSELLSCIIKCESAEIYDGLEPGEFVAEFYDSDGNVMPIAPIWDVSCDFIDDLTITHVENAVLISVNNSKLINKSFKLTLSGDGYEPVSLMVTIKAFW